MTLTHGDLFAGVGGWTLGFDRTGEIETRWHVEIDPQCQSILRRHWPSADVFGDIRDCGIGRRHRLAPVDFLTISSPCQGLSAAGKREGLADERSHLFYEGIRLVRELTPSLVIWENVYGALSSSAGRDFAAVLTAFFECGPSDLAWGTLDARYAGVPQRRRRVFVAVDFSSGGRRAGEILFERDGVSWHPAPRRTPGQGVATASQGSPGSRGHVGFVEGELNGETVSTLVGSGQGKRGWQLSAEQAAGGQLVAIAGSLTARYGKGPNSTVDDGAVVLALTANGVGTSGADDNQTRAGHQVPCLRTGGGYRIRRLMPVECARLMGWPDGHLTYGHDGTSMSDAFQYRACGNGVVASVSEHLGRRVLAAWHGEEAPS